MIEKYFEDELRYLYESGCEFAKAHPDRANYLNIDSVGDRDPYVERLFEGFAFLAGRIREKLDDTFPQLTEGLTNLLWPQYLLEVPALSIVQFDARPGSLQEAKLIPVRSEVLSQAIGNEALVCKFTTAAPVMMNPITLTSVNRITDSMNNDIFTFKFQLDKTVQWGKYNLQQLRLFLFAEMPTSLMLHRAFTTNVKRVELEFDNGTVRHELDPLTTVTPGGLSPDESLMPEMRRSFWGYNLLREYFIYPEKFLFLDINGIDKIPEPAETPESITLRFTIGEALPADKRFSLAMFRMNCCPVVNAFISNTEPIVKTGLQSEYRVVANATFRKEMRVHSVRSVVGVDRITGERYNYEPAYTFNNLGNKQRKTYSTRFVKTAAGAREMNLMLGGAQLKNKEIGEESLVIEAWCTNGEVPRDSLVEGQISAPGKDFPDFIKISNITRPTLPYLPPEDDELLWIFQAHLVATQGSMANRDVLKKFLQLYNWSGQEGRARRIEAIADVSSEPMECLYKGSIIRGVRFSITFEEQAFRDTGDVHLFGLVLSKFLSHYTAINSFCELKVILKPSGKVLTWSQIEGKRCLI
jgi:type VI secretion system protein ImpG